MKPRPRSFMVPCVLMFLIVYGMISFYRDWLSKPIIRACDYIDSMGADFWWLLLAAGLIVWLVGRRVNAK